MNKKWRTKWKDSEGFTLIELIIVMAVIAVLLSAVIPAFQGMQREGEISKAEMELETLKTAVISFRRHTGGFPTNITTDLTGASPNLINENLTDPFNTAAGTYGYDTNTDASFGEWFFIYSQGVDLTDATSFVGANDQVEITAGADDIAVSNAPVVKL